MFDVFVVNVNIGCCHTVLTLSTSWNCVSSGSRICGSTSSSE